MPSHLWFMVNLEPHICCLNAKSNHEWFCFLFIFSKRETNSFIFPAHSCVAYLSSSWWPLRIVSCRKCSLSLRYIVSVNSCHWICGSVGLSPLIIPWKSLEGQDGKKGPLGVWGLLLDLSLQGLGAVWSLCKALSGSIEWCGEETELRWRYWDARRSAGYIV